MQSHRYVFGEAVENDRHRTAFVEVSIGGKNDATTWLAGAAIQLDDYRSKSTFSLRL